MIKNSLLIAMVGFVAITASAQEDVISRQTKIAAAIFATKHVQNIAKAAKENAGVLETDDRGFLSDEIDCSVNPNPYGQPDKSFCFVQVEAAYGWYADPVLKIQVKAFIQIDKIKSGEILESDLLIREVSAITPDPTGLE